MEPASERSATSFLHERTDAPCCRSSVEHYSGSIALLRVLDDLLVAPHKLGIQLGHRVLLHSCVLDIADKVALDSRSLVVEQDRKDRTVRRLDKVGFVRVGVRRKGGIDRVAFGDPAR